jgi:hypothetical protein
VVAFEVNKNYFGSAPYKLPTAYLAVLRIATFVLCPQNRFSNFVKSVKNQTGTNVIVLKIFSSKNWRTN